jgi:hypothetical protein
MEVRLKGEWVDCKRVVVLLIVYYKNPLVSHLLVFAKSSSSRTANSPHMCFNASSIPLYYITSIPSFL